jgi:hypothetical protein
MKWIWGLVSVILIVALTYFIYPRRYQVTARIWHWRHGNTVQFGNYIIPIPADWFVNDSPPGIELIDAGFASRPHFFPGTSSTIVLLNPGPKKIDLNSWQFYRRQELVRSGMQNIEERTIGQGDGTAVCVGGDLFQEVMHIPLAGLVSVDCQSTGGLHLLFSGYVTDLPSFYALVAGMHPTSNTQ